MIKLSPMLSISKDASTYASITIKRLNICVQTEADIYE